MIAALYVERDGVYSGLPEVDLWDESRDARNYDGPHAVVAHPPCQLWGAMALVNHKRWGGEHNRPGNDGGCFAAALASVRRWGGVLEHPARTRAWEAHSLTAPVGIGWAECNTGEWVCEVWQSAYGHLANKATWLFCVSDAEPLPILTARPTGSHQCGGADRRGKARNKPTLSGKYASATPPKFRDFLISIAAQR